MENHHAINGKTHYQWPFYSFLYVYQRVTIHIWFILQDANLTQIWPPQPHLQIAHGDTRSPAFFFAFVAVFVPVEAVLAVLAACIPKLVAGFKSVWTMSKSYESHLMSIIAM